VGRGGRTGRLAGVLYSEERVEAEKRPATGDDGRTGRRAIAARKERMGWAAATYHGRRSRRSKQDEGAAGGITER
jgi:hypothetical protein